MHYKKAVCKMTTRPVPSRFKHFSKKTRMRFVYKIVRRKTNRPPTDPTDRPVPYRSEIYFIYQILWKSIKIRRFLMTINQLLMKFDEHLYFSQFSFFKYYFYYFNWVVDEIWWNFVKFDQHQIKFDEKQSNSDEM